MSVEMSAIRDGLVANIQTVITDAQVRPYRLANPTPPTILVTGFDEITPTTFQGGGYELAMLIQGLAGLSTDEGAQRRLDEWLSPMGASNVWRAIETDRTLGGIVASVRVTSCDGTQIFELDNGARALASTWHVTIDL